jgi:hypothetical protein
VRAVVRIEKVPVLMSLLPVAVQLAGITTLLVAVRQDLAWTLIGIAAGLVWLKVTESKLQDKYGELRAQRQLFITLGEWLDRADAEKRVDEVISGALMAQGSIEDEDYKVAVAADSIANAVRKLASILLQVYVVIVVWQWWTAQASLQG